MCNELYFESTGILQKHTRKNATVPKSKANA